YRNDTLTQRGFMEAELLSKRLEKEEMTRFYVSTLGRAQDTAAPTLRMLGLCGEGKRPERIEGKVEICDWLREMWPLIDRPDRPDRKTICWNFLPEDWTTDPLYYDPQRWCTTEAMKSGSVKKAWEYITENFDRTLAEHGYVREGNMYRAERPNRDTLVFFCHIGNAGVLMSHLMNVSPMVFWHQVMLSTTSVTTFYTEERREGKAVFRSLCIGDYSHLTMAGENPSFSGRFCETFDNPDERHD
ncbi:MAG: histidine phosphatase family protein, partial [Lachnospiraceae bacterium]|nr:histidine phosphatase family protein [Lachnospiraceae bacterium]